MILLFFKNKIHISFTLYYNKLYKNDFLHQKQQQYFLCYSQMTTRHILQVFQVLIINQDEAVGTVMEKGRMKQANPQSVSTVSDPVLTVKQNVHHEPAEKLMKTQVQQRHVHSNIQMWDNDRFFHSVFHSNLFL